MRLIPVLIVAAVVVAFLPALGNGFTNWDDQKNFLTNLEYRGLGPAQLKWMFSTFLLGHWHPLTWLTLGLDYVVWGMNPLGYHLTSLLIHAANAILLYGLLQSLLRLAGRAPLPAAAAAGALLYAIHPLRVESVVWITERRDVLCGFFVLLSLTAYLKRVDEERQGRPGTRWLLLSVAAFAASLMSKALGILLPAVLLILDIYPLGRFQPENRRRVLLEKLPFLLLSCADAAVMVFAMRHIQAVRSIGTYHLFERIAQAAYGLCFYPLKMLWPSPLIPLYRIEKTLNPWEAKYVLAMVAVAGTTAALVAFRRRIPWGLAAWLCYGILVSPVLGVAVTGMQIVADRYSYLCLLPASVLLTAALDRLGRNPSTCRAAAGGAALALALLGLLTTTQSLVWRDSITLWSHQLRFDPDCDLAYNSRGAARQDRGDALGAIEDCTRSIQLEPAMADPYLNRGLARAGLGDLDRALQDFDRVIELAPSRADGFTNRGVTRIRMGDPEGAMADLTLALERNGSKAETYAARGSLRASRGDLRRAVEDFEQALREAPPEWPPRADVERKLDRARRLR
ncbi:MAG TPA: hypothetical protein VE981_03790 [Planctomycetota bacterium]|nr:hypothetical protein [Planctomycetota bacterium]